ncbi:uncharacterized protein METZ01_LOCUS231718 [marine metagenome]|uniref:Uncharacterized protein n=1 Tax=marine metagenome TaxID=408172 RepID=A0A382GVG2_9ZZZZ
MGQNGRILCSRNGIFVIDDETGNAIDAHTPSHTFLSHHQITVCVLTE